MVVLRRRKEMVSRIASYEINGHKRTIEILPTRGISADIATLLNVGSGKSTH